MFDYTNTFLHIFKYVLAIIILIYIENKIPLYVLIFAMLSYDIYRLNRKIQNNRDDSRGKGVLFD